MEEKRRVVERRAEISIEYDRLFLRGRCLALFVLVGRKGEKGYMCDSG